MSTTIIKPLVASLMLIFLTLNSFAYVHYEEEEIRHESPSAEVTAQKINDYFSSAPLAVNG